LSCENSSWTANPALAEMVSECEMPASYALFSPARSVKTEAHESVCASAGANKTNKKKDKKTKRTK